MDSPSGRCKLVPRLCRAPVTSPRLHTRLAGLDLPNPVGLAAGFDKNAQALNGLVARRAFPAL